MMAESRSAGNAGARAGERAGENASPADRRVAIVGCGPGGADHVTPAARRAAEEAEVLVGAPRLLALFPGTGAEQIPVGRDLAVALDLVADRVARGRRVAVLVTGDPGLCSLARPVLRRFGPDACRVVPGISSLQVACARLGLDWLDARVLSAHRVIPEGSAEDLRGFPLVAVLLGRPEALPWLADLALRLGDRRLFVCEDLTLETERIREVAGHEVAGLSAGSLGIALLVKEASVT